MHDLSTIPIWHRGSVVLLGDAAHATSPNAGQGASLAMEDALVLGLCLRDIPEVDGALATYQQLRRERAEKVVAYSRRQGRLNPRMAPRRAREQLQSSRKVTIG